VEAKSIGGNLDISAMSGNQTKAYHITKIPESLTYLQGCEKIVLKLEAVIHDCSAVINILNSV
jgi:hypothetical protein